MISTKGSLCSGYGGLDLALPGTLTFTAELDESASRVLKREHSDVPNLGDITILAAPYVDLLSAGFPCQPVSAAGRQRAHDDHRWLWPSVLRIIRQSGPAEIFLENVQNIASIQGGAVLAVILAGLRAAGYACRWTILGACAVGAPHHRHRWFLRGTYVGEIAPEAHRVTVKCGAPRGGGRDLLPTPVVRDADHRGEGSAEYWQARAARGKITGMPLGAAVALLPTPQARDGGERGTPSREHAQRRADNPSRSVPLEYAVALLPTPRATDGVNGGPNQRGRRGDLAMGSACQPEVWGWFAEAVELWEGIIGRPAPEPTVLAPKGGQRLNPALSEWMMGLPEGLVTADMARNDALRLAGNGVVPLQAATAFEILA